MSPVYDEEHLIIGIAHNVQNVTERKNKELQLIESENKLQKTLEAIPHPLVIVNEDITIQYVNEEFEKVFGYTESEVLDKSIDFLTPERYRNGHIMLHQNYMEEGGKSMRMGRFLEALTKSGKEIIIDASLNSFSANGKKFDIVIIQDVTELKKKQETILKQNEAFRAISWLQSHELRRPVANILGLCDLLKNSSQESDEMRNKYIEYMIQVTQELDSIVHKIVESANKSEEIEN